MKLRRLFAIGMLLALASPAVGGRAEAAVDSLDGPSKAAYAEPGI